MIKSDEVKCMDEYRLPSADMWCILDSDGFFVHISDEFTQLLRLFINKHEVVCGGNTYNRLFNMKHVNMHVLSRWKLGHSSIPDVIQNAKIRGNPLLIIGGFETYRHMLPLVDRIHIQCIESKTNTRVHFFDIVPSAVAIRFACRQGPMLSTKKAVFTYERQVGAVSFFNMQKDVMKLKKAKKQSINWCTSSSLCAQIL